MGVSRIDTWPKFLVGSSDGLWIDPNGRIVLEPDNFWPNQYLQNADENGEPAEHDLSGIADPIIGYHVNVSKPGDPRRQSMARQTTTFVPTNEGSWSADGPWVAGGRVAPTDDRVPATPEIDDAPNGSRGWDAGTYGYAIGYASLWGSTTITAYRYFTLADGEYPIIPVPEGFASGVVYVEIYMTTKTGGDDTGRLQLRVPVSNIRGSDIPVYGPWRNRGKPPATNQSGIGRPQQPPKRNSKTRSSSRGDTLAGIWQPAYQLYIPGMGASLVGKTGERLKVKGDRKRVKVNDSGDVEGESVQSADVVYMDITPPGRRRGASRYYGEEIHPTEAAFVGALNDARAADGDRNDLTLNAALNRAAWRHASRGFGKLADLAYDEGYRDPALGTTSKHDAPHNVVNELVKYPGLRILDDWREIGVARGPRGWSIILGDGEPDVPNVATFETVDEDGTIHACDPDVHPDDLPGVDGVQFADATAQLTWDCVINGSLDYSYNGSYTSAVQHAASQMRSACGLTMDSGGLVLDITDGALPAGVAGRTYSDGRMILSSALMANATDNAREAITTHETGHAGRLAHDEGTTVMRPSITLNSNSNINAYTAEDKATLTSLWGQADATAGGGSGGGGASTGDGPDAHGGGQGGTPKGTGGNEVKQPEDHDERTGDDGSGNDWHYEVQTSSVAKNTVLFLRPPKILKRQGRAIGMKYTAWWFHRDENGNETPYVVRPKGGRVGAQSYFRKSLKVAGVPGGEAVEGESGRSRGNLTLVGETPPEDDATEIESPDPTSAPDAPFIGGKEVLPAGRYVADVQGITESGGVTRPSDLARQDNGLPYIDITTLTMPKIYLPQTVNLVKNAEGTTLDQDGNAEDWGKIAATTPAYFRPRIGGGFDVGATSSTANLVRGEARRIMLSDTDTLTVAGDIGVWRQAVGGGGVRVALQCFDVDSAPLSTLVAGELNAVGDIKFKHEFGPGVGATAWPAGLSYVVIDVRVYQPAAGNINVEGYVENLRAYPYPEDIGKAILEGNFGDFNPPADTPAPSGSFMAVGLPPSPGSGASPPEAEAPTAYTGFESSAPGTGWALGGTLAPTYVSAPSAIHETKSIRFADTSKTVKQHGWVETTAAALADEAAYFRGLYVFDTLPAAGRTRFHAQYDGTALVFAVNVDKNGVLILEYTNASGKITLKTLTTKITAGQLVDIETVVLPGTTGLLELYVGLGGGGRSRAATIPWELFGRSGHRCLAGFIAHTDSAARPIVRADQLVVTPRGDVANREQPAAPVAGYTPEPIDRPFDASVPREFDVDNADIYQLRGFVEPGTTAAGPRIIPLLDDAINVRPGSTYAFGAYCRYTGFTDDVSEFRVILHGEGMAPLSAAVIPLTGRLAWADRAETFVVPDGYTYASPELSLYPSFIVAQEFGKSRGAVLVRGYGRAAIGTGTFEIDALPDNPHFPRFLSEVGAKELADPSESPGELVATIATTNDRINYLSFTDPVDKALRYYRVDLDVTGDGRNGPEVAELYTRSWCPIGQVCDPEGAPINAYVGNLFTASSYPDVEPRRAAGRSANVPDSDDVLQGSSLEITAFDEDAANLVMRLSRRATIQLNVPTAGGTAAGKSYEVRIEGGIKLAPEDAQLAGVDVFGRRDVVYKGTAEVIDVISEGALPAPMGLIDPTFAPSLAEGDPGVLVP